MNFSHQYVQAVLNTCVPAGPTTQFSLAGTMFELQASTLQFHLMHGEDKQEHGVVGKLSTFQAHGPSSGSITVSDRYNLLMHPVMLALSSLFYCGLQISAVGTAFAHHYFGSPVDVMAMRMCSSLILTWLEASANDVVLQQKLVRDIIEEVHNINTILSGRDASFTTTDKSKVATNILRLAYASQCSIRFSAGLPPALPQPQHNEVGRAERLQRPVVRQIIAVPLFSFTDELPATVQARRDAVQAKIDADPTYRIFDNNAVRRSFSEFLLQLPDGAVRRQPCVLGETAYVLDGEQRIFAPADMPMASFWIIPGLNGAMSHARVATVAWPSDSKDKQAAYSHRHVLQAPGFGAQEDKIFVAVEIGLRYGLVHSLDLYVYTKTLGRLLMSELAVERLAIEGARFHIVCVSTVARHAFDDLLKVSYLVKARARQLQVKDAEEDRVILTIVDQRAPSTQHSKQYLFACEGEEAIGIFTTSGNAGECGWGVKAKDELNSTESGVLVVMPTACLPARAFLHQRTAWLHHLASTNRLFDNLLSSLHDPLRTAEDDARIHQQWVQSLAEKTARRQRKQDLRTTLDATGIKYVPPPVPDADLAAAAAALSLGARPIADVLADRHFAKTFDAQQDRPEDAGRASHKIFVVAVPPVGSVDDLAAVQDLRRRPNTTGIALCLCGVTKALTTTRAHPKLSETANPEHYAHNCAQLGTMLSHAGGVFFPREDLVREGGLAKMFDTRQQFLNASLRRHAKPPVYFSKLTSTLKLTVVAQGKRLAGFWAFFYWRQHRKNTSSLDGIDAIKTAFRLELEQFKDWRNPHLEAISRMLGNEHNLFTQNLSQQYGPKTYHSQHQQRSWTMDSVSLRMDRWDDVVRNMTTYRMSTGVAAREGRMDDDDGETAVEPRAGVLPLESDSQSEGSDEDLVTQTTEAEELEAQDDEGMQEDEQSEEENEES